LSGASDVESFLGFARQARFGERISKGEVIAAIKAQPPGALVMVSDGEKLLASRPGNGQSAVLLWMESTPERCRRADGRGYSMRLTDSAKVRKAILGRKRAD
jgi:hypothetical protein